MGTGCKNWADLQMAEYPSEPFITLSEEDCFRACEATADCQYGNWQKKENSECPDKAPAGFPYASKQGKGACYMFKKTPEGCTGNKASSSADDGTGEENVCWNLCTKEAVVVLPTTTTTTV